MGNGDTLLDYRSQSLCRTFFEIACPLSDADYTSRNTPDREEGYALNGIVAGIKCALEEYPIIGDDIKRIFDGDFNKESQYRECLFLLLDVYHQYEKGKIPSSKVLWCLSRLCEILDYQKGIAVEWMFIVLSCMFFIFGLIAGGFSMFAMVRWTQLYRTRITKEDIGRNIWSVFMQQLDD